MMTFLSLLIALAPTALASSPAPSRVVALPTSDGLSLDLIDQTPEMPLVAGAAQEIGEILAVSKRVKLPASEKTLVDGKLIHVELSPNVVAHFTLERGKSIYSFDKSALPGASRLILMGEVATELASYLIEAGLPTELSSTTVEVKGQRVSCITSTLEFVTPTCTIVQPH